MAYVYRHVRLDKNEIFYVGIGEDQGGEEYQFKSSLARDKRHRNPRWHNITKKTKYRVEILLNGLTWEQACWNEKFFISLYGRADKGEGTLVNMTDGGDGSKGMILSEESKKKMSVAFKNKSYQDLYGDKAEEEKEKKRLAAKKQWETQNLEERLRKKEKIEKKKTDKENIRLEKIKAKKEKTESFLLRKERRKEVLLKKELNGGRRKDSKYIIQKDLNDNTIKVWDKFSSIQKEYGKNYRIQVFKCCNGLNKIKRIYDEYKWEYID